MQDIFTPRKSKIFFICVSPTVSATVFNSSPFGRRMWLNKLNDKMNKFIKIINDKTKIENIVIKMKILLG
jgi:hypothetical protein